MTPSTQATPQRAGRLIWLMALGYGYVLGMLALALWGILAIFGAATGDGGGVIAALALGLLVFVILRAFFVRVQGPTGRRISASEAPALFAEIEEVRRALDAPPVHAVLIDPELNAGAAQIPRFGPFGPHRNVLIVGLPLLGAQSRAGWRATLAHELGHLAGGDGRQIGRIYRLRERWIRLAASWDAASTWTSFVFAPFARWYAPRLAAASLAVSRELERRADARAAAIAGREAAVDSLVRVALAARRLPERFWPTLEAEVATRPEPPGDVFERLLRELRAPLEGDTARAWFTAAMAERTADGDTHPALAERLAALGAAELPATARGLPALEESAAEALLGEALTSTIAADFSRKWAEARAGAWALDHEEAVARVARLVELDALAAHAHLKEGERRERALLTLRAKGPAAALPLLEAEVEAAGDDAGLRLALGRALADVGDPRAATTLEAVAADSVEHRLAAWERLRDLVAAQGDEEATARWAAEVQRWREGLAHAAAERAHLAEEGPFLPHDLEDHEIERLARGLAQIPEVAAAWLVRREVRHLPELPAYVLAVLPTFDGQRVFRASAERELFEAILAGPPLPGPDPRIVILGDYSLGLRGTLQTVPGGLVYARPPT